VTDLSNLDLVHSIYADWERGDYSQTGWAHPEIEWVIAVGSEPARSTGPEAMAMMWRDLLSTVEDYRSQPDEFRQIDRERVLVLGHRSGHGKMSGLDLGQIQNQGAALFHVRDGKVTRLVVYTDRDRALADLGLEA